MKLVWVGLVLLALGGFVIFAMWPHDSSSAKRRDRSNDTIDRDTNGIIPGSGGDKPHYGHHGDAADSHDVGSGDSGGYGGH